MPSGFKLLNSLPEELLLRVLSKLDLDSRQIVRRCSKLLTQAIAQSVFYTTGCSLRFDYDEEGFVRLTVNGSNKYLHANYAIEDDINEFVLKKKGNFRRAYADTLEIDGSSADFSLETLGKLTENIHFRTLDVYFFYKIHPSVIQFMQRCEDKPVRLTFRECSLSLCFQAISQSPSSLSFLRVKQLPNEEVGRGFNDEEIMKILEKEAEWMTLPLTLSSPTTVAKIISTIKSSAKIKRVKLHFYEGFFHRFLEFIRLREEPTHLLDVSNANAPIALGAFDEHPAHEYMLDYGSCQVEVVARMGDGRHMITVQNEEMSERDREIFPWHRVN